MLTQVYNLQTDYRKITSGAYFMFPIGIDRKEVQVCTSVNK